MTAFSILDLCPIVEGGTVSQAIADTRALAKTAEDHDFVRFWLAEHHGMPGIASAATALIIAEAGHATNTIRIGSGGIMLPNHSPLVIAEQFGTLAAMFPGRVDLGLGRAPGTDQQTAKALRRNLDSGANSFPQDIIELQRLFGKPNTHQRPIATPGADTRIPIWLLGSSLYSAQLAAALGLPYAFASHFAPDLLLQALSIYRNQFKPSKQLKKPYVIAGVMASVADTDEEATYHFTSVQQSFVNAHRDARGQMPPPVKSMDGIWNEMERHSVERMLRCSIVGSLKASKQLLGRFIETTKADEIMVSLPLFSTEARLHSVRHLAKIRDQLNDSAELSSVPTTLKS